MALTRQQNWLGQQRVDAPDLRSLESAVANDFDLLAGKTMGGGKALVVRGFTIDVTNTLNNPVTNLVLRTAGGILMHWGATEAGTLLQVPDDQPNDTLNSSNAKVVGGFASSALNYVGIDFQRSADASTSDVTKFVSATTNQESTRTVPKARTLSYKIVISTTPFSLSTNVCPIARVQTDSQNRVLSITDCRQMFWRLGRGGDVPDAYAGFTWTDADRRENPITYIAGSTNDPFSGGDKAITNLKDWMDAVTHVLWEAKSGEHWYSPTSRDCMKVAFGPALLSNGFNFDWVLGSSTLTWKNVFVVFENSSGSYYNAVTDGSAVLAAGQCLYVDINRTASDTVRNINAGGLVRTGGNLVTATTTVAHGYTTGQSVLVTTATADVPNFATGTKTITVTGATTFTYAETGSNVASGSAATAQTPTYAPVVGALQSLPAPVIPGSRMILAWRLGDSVYMRDYPFETGRLLAPVATTTSDGIVRLNQTPANALHPVVLNLGVNGNVTWSATGGNATAAVVTGNGSGNGLTAIGGASGQGVYASGGSAGGYGVYAVGGISGADTAVYAVCTGAVQYAVKAEGSVYVEANSGNRSAVTATGIGSGAGGVFTGGATDGPGIRATAGGAGFSALLTGSARFIGQSQIDVQPTASGAGETLTVASGNGGGTDQEGSELVLRVGYGTGNAAVKPIRLRTATKGASGSSTQTAVDHLIYPGLIKFSAMNLPTLSAANLDGNNFLVLPIHNGHAFYDNSGTNADLTINGLQLLEYSGGPVVAPGNVGAAYGISSEGLTMRMTIYVHSTKQITLKHQAAGGTANERFIVGGNVGADYVSAVGFHITCDLSYSATLSRWIVRNITEFQ